VGVPRGIIDAAFMTPQEGTRDTLVDEERAGPPDGHPGEPHVGDRIGRYLLMHRIGAGGMGVVFAAHDPELDRTVALKVLRTSQRDRGPAARARFVREAQAMARVTHPNVVEIYDVGTADDYVFIAMAFVDGLTLSSWLRAEHRSWREIVHTFIAAGRGLAAAHAHGIVHRDFKPDNVLLSQDGPLSSVRVVDFGLARGTGSLDSLFTPDVVSSPGRMADDEIVRPLGHTQLTGAGTVMGTPGYMAPEQHRGRPIDPRADQYAFCVALFEALYGSRPFHGRTLAELLHNKEAGTLPPERHGSEVPRAIREAIVRGLSPAPEGRFPGMDALLRQLEGVLRPRRAWPWVAAVGMAGLAMVIVAQPGAVTQAGCEDPEQRLAVVWNDEQRAAAASAFESVPYGAEAWTHTEAALDDRARAWVTAYRSTCAATDDAELDRAMRCLADRLDGLETVVSVLAEADAEAVRRASAVTTALPSPEDCAREEGDEALPLPPDPTRAAAVIDVRRRLNRASLLEDMGRYKAAVGVAEDAHVVAQQLRWPAIAAEAQVGLGGALERTGEYRRAAALLEEGALAAMALGLDHVALDGITQLVFLAGFRNDDLAGAERWARQGLALLDRLDPGDGTEARLVNAYGTLWDAMGDFETSHRYFERARELFEAAYGPQHPNVGAARQNVGIALIRLGDYEAARVELSRALAIQRAVSGNAHPDTANALDNLGSALQRLGRNAEAQEATREALQLRRRALGEHHPEVARSYTNLGAIEEAEGDFARAEEHYGRAAAIFAAVMGPDNATTAAAEVNHALMLERAGDPTRALEILRSAVPRMQALLPPEHPHHAFAHLALARTHLALGEPAVALQHADDALALCRTSDVEPMACALTKFARARALWADEARREEARLEAEAAHRELQTAGTAAPADLREVDAWLEQHRP
jgi:tetratricopeptide (TPR) repeat protein